MFLAHLLLGVAGGVMVAILCSTGLWGAVLIYVAAGSAICSATAAMSLTCAALSRH